MKVLLVYPECPSTFWSFRWALRFVLRKTAQPPLGLLTVAAMLPREWDKRLVDMNTKRLRDRDLAWADIVFVSAMSIQRDSAKEVVRRARAAHVRVVAGGPLFTSEPEQFPDVDHLVLNEAEATLPEFLADLQKGEARRVYTRQEYLPLAPTPVPLWELVDKSKYSAMNVQYSRGCPFDCEFCDIGVLFGNKVRTKSKNQLLTELDALYHTGWRGSVFFVDDNFIGNRRKLKTEVLPALVAWSERRKHPFDFETEVSVDMADDDELMALMLKAGFNSVFVGIETPNEESLKECSKVQNLNRDLLDAVRRMHRAGFIVKAGFILGFDHDPPTIFDQLSLFIQTSGIATAMVGLLNVPRNTRLHRRLEKEGRMLGDSAGDNTAFSTNFRPTIGSDRLADGYRSVIRRIYSVRPYYERVRLFLKEYRQPRRKARWSKRDLFAFFGAVVRIGIIGRERWRFWHLFWWTLVRRPRLLPTAITLTIYGFHFRKFYADCL
jgi:radical SAM superfamily enzyme YgiQ (UPF0313 family)